MSKAKEWAKEVIQDKLENDKQWEYEEISRLRSYLAHQELELSCYGDSSGDLKTEIEYLKSKIAYRFETVATLEGYGNELSDLLKSA